MAMYTLQTRDLERHLQLALSHSCLKDTYKLLCEMSNSVDVELFVFVNKVM